MRTFPAKEEGLIKGGGPFLPWGGGLIQERRTFPAPEKEGSFRGKGGPFLPLRRKADSGEDLPAPEKEDLSYPREGRLIQSKTFSAPEEEGSLRGGGPSLPQRRKTDTGEEDLSCPQRRRLIQGRMSWPDPEEEGSFRGPFLPQRRKADSGEEDLSCLRGGRLIKGKRTFPVLNRRADSGEKDL